MLCTAMNNGISLSSPQPTSNSGMSYGMATVPPVYYSQQVATLQIHHQNQQQPTAAKRGRDDDSRTSHSQQPPRQQQQYQPLFPINVPTQVYNPLLTTYNSSHGPSVQQQQQNADDDQNNLQATQQAPSKKSRSVMYQAPRDVKPSVLKAMGSIAGGTRRRLSGGHLEEFLGGHDTMETGDMGAESRPRSMSF
jgi:hypothetical protein